MPQGFEKLLSNRTRGGGKKESYSFQRWNELWAICLKRGRSRQDHHPAGRGKSYRERERERERIVKM